MANAPLAFAKEIQRMPAPRALASSSLVCWGSAQYCLCSVHGRSQHAEKEIALLFMLEVGVASDLMASRDSRGPISYDGYCSRTKMDAAANSLVGHLGGIKGIVINPFTF